MFFPSFHIDKKVAKLFKNLLKLFSLKTVSQESDISLTEDSRSQHVATKPTPSQTVNVRSLSLFALIIGINKYTDPDIPDLRCAVNDADAIEQFLTSEIGVPKDRVVNLRDEGATRAAILAALRNLAHHGAISAHDPILVYYAGHGSEALIPVGDINNANGIIQMLLPHDFELKGSQNAQRQGIFDITLSLILADIATKKSDNITVILDCCHSGSATRQTSSELAPAIRGLVLPSNYTIPADIFAAETQTRSRAGETGINSHVLLAACKRKQFAQEIHGHGFFTRALLTLLRQEGIYTLTYSDVIKRIPNLPLQNPQCEGVNQNRILFGAKTHPHHPIYNICQRPGKSNEYTLEAGAAHGIAHGAEFAVYIDKLQTSIAGTVVVSRLAPFTSRCFAVSGTPITLSRSAYAVQTRAGEGQDLRLFIEPTDAFLDLFVRLSSNTKAYQRLFRFVNNDDKPDLVVKTQGGLVRFEIKDVVCSRYGLDCMPFYDVRPDETEFLLSILCSAADFYWHLRHSNKDDSLTKSVNVECFRLEISDQFTDDLDEIFIPEPGGQNLNINGTILIDVEEDAVYGYRILNTSDKPLYVALFYMDISDLSIVPYYLPATAARGQADFSLPPNESLSIGFGDGGWAPLTYYLRENQNVDVGFLKLYVSVEYVDYSVGIGQPSPFERARGDIFAPRKRGTWGALTIPIIQRKGVSNRTRMHIDD